MRQALEAFGASAEDIQAALADRGPDIPSLWPENAPAFDLFLAMGTQLRTAGINGRVIGFDYAVLPWVMRQIGIARRDMADVFRRFQIAEDEFIR